MHWVEPASVLQGTEHQRLKCILWCGTKTIRRPEQNPVLPIWAVAITPLPRSDKPLRQAWLGHVGMFEFGTDCRPRISTQEFQTHQCIGSNDVVLWLALSRCFNFCTFGSTTMVYTHYVYIYILYLYMVYVHYHIPILAYVPIISYNIRIGICAASLWWSKNTLQASPSQMVTRLQVAADRNASCLDSLRFKQDGSTQADLDPQTQFCVSQKPAMIVMLGCKYWIACRINIIWYWSFGAMQLLNHFIHFVSFCTLWELNGAPHVSTKALLCVNLFMNF